MSNFSLVFDFSEHCLYRRHNRVKFSFVSTRLEGILQLVHSNVFGPMSVPSLDKYVHYVSIIDAFSIFPWHFKINSMSKSQSQTQALFTVENVQ